MTGFLIYEGDQAVGWCNAGDKMNYAPICENVDFMTPNMEKGQIKILYCMDIADGWQGRGIANLIMEKFLEDAEKEGVQNFHCLRSLPDFLLWCEPSDTQCLF